jgi:hypothetical protein
MRLAHQRSLIRSFNRTLPYLPLLTLLAGAPATAQPLCVYGVSKNLCMGQLIAGWQAAACGVNPTGTACNTASLHQAPFNGLLTPGGATCDEVPELDGTTLTAFFDGELRLQLPDRFRGALIGRFSIFQSDQTPAAAGTFDGTLGVGTHRPMSCTCSSTSCEDCYAVSFNASSQIWSIHSEGFLDGSFNGKLRPGCKIHWSYSGAFSTPGKADGPQLNGLWSFCGAIDGVIECPCPQQETKPKHPGS